MAIFVPHHNLAKLLGVASQMQTNAPTVGALIAEIEAKLKPEEFKKAMAAAILVNGRNIRFLQGRDTPLGERDEVWMVFPSAGG
jgi:molybdopterin converting factor small subunit